MRLGDLDFEESIVLETASERAASASIASSPRRARRFSTGAANLEAFQADTPEGQISHQYGRQVVIRRGGGSASATATARSSMKSASSFNIPRPSPAMTLTENEGLRAMAYRASPEFAASRPLNGQEWHFGGKPESLPSAAKSIGAGARSTMTNAQAAKQANAPTSERMVGSTVVCSIFVDGPTPELSFTDDEKIAINAGVQHGLSWLASLSPKSNISWKHHIEIVSVNTPTNTFVGGARQMEIPWRDPVMMQIQGSAGPEAVHAYVRKKIRQHRTKNGFAAFFTKYKIWNFAYAWLGGPYLVMNNTLNGWGIGNFDRVFAHEVCHIFHAPDEYAESGCNCGGQHGYYGHSNLNCESCATDLLPCVMRRNEAVMCKHTRLHVGFEGESSRFVGV